MADEAVVESSSTQNEAAAPDLSGNAAGAKDEGTVESPATDEAQDANSAPVADEPKSMLEAVKAAMSKAEAKAEESSTPEAKDGGEASPVKSDEQVAAKPAEKLDPLHKHPRFQEVLRERDDARRDRDSWKHGHEQFDKIRTFMASNRLNDEEANQGFAIMAAMKNDPAEALKLLKPYYESLQRLAGEVMPEDIRKKVDEGLLDQDTGAEIARLRGSTEMSAAQLRQQHEHLQAQAREQALSGMRGAVDGWEANLMTRDPDYAKKKPQIERILKGLITEKPPKTPQDAVQLAQQAYDDVNNWLRTVVTAQKPEVRSPNGGAASSANTRPEPRSMLEAMRQARGAGVAA